MFGEVSCSYVKNTRNNDVVVVYDQGELFSSVKKTAS